MMKPQLGGEMLQLHTKSAFDSPTFPADNAGVSVEYALVSFFFFLMGWRNLNRKHTSWR